MCASTPPPNILTGVLGRTRVNKKVCTRSEEEILLATKAISANSQITLQSKSLINVNVKVSPPE